MYIDFVSEWSIYHKEILIIRNDYGIFVAHQKISFVKPLIASIYGSNKNVAQGTS